MPRNPYLGAAFGVPPSPYVAQNVPFPYPMKTPEQYREELMKSVQPQLDQYTGLYNQQQAQAQIQANSGNYVKVNSYEEVKGIQAPDSGRPIMIFDETNGRLYSKRFENGQSFIKGFTLVPLEEQQEEQPKQEPKEDKLDLILGKLESFDKRIADLEGKKDGAV